MRPEELQRVALFVTAVVTVYVVAIAFAVRWFLQRRGHRHWAIRAIDGEAGLRAVAFGAAVFGVLCIAYGRFIEPSWLEVTHIQIESERWTGKPLRIVQLSDTHSEVEANLELRLPAVVREQKPDLIVFTGDAVNTPLGLPVFKQFLAQIAEIAPTVVVRGNWDVWQWSQLALFEGTGAREVANSAVTIPVRGQDVWIGGLTVDEEHGLRALLESAPRDRLRILLHHYPDEVVRAAKLGVDLYLAGHTHGGQIALPFYGALVTLSDFGKEFESGLHRVGDTWEYTNRGIGLEGSSAPRVRFAARPEVTVIDVM